MLLAKELFSDEFRLAKIRKKKKKKLARFCQNSTIFFVGSGDFFSPDFARITIEG
jgi:hypothetical protein